MPHYANSKPTWPQTGAPESVQAGRSLPGPRNALDPGTRIPDPGRQVGAAAEVRNLRELCHDLTIPATAIRLLASVAVKESDPDPALKTRLHQIADEATRIAEICGYFLNPSRGAGPADLRALAAAAADSARSRYSGTIDVAAETVMVAAHPVDVTRILANLVDNACRAAGPEGRVRLVVERDGDRAQIVVADSGGGPAHGESGRASLGLGIVATLTRRSDGVLRMSASDLGGLAMAVTLPEARPSTSGTQRGIPGGEAG
jgi:signal transduction histidine kinase